MPVISLITVFGIKKETVGVMVRMILRINHLVRDSELSHLLQPQRNDERSFFLEAFRVKDG